MPEGDTIFRAARTLHRALAGKPVVRFETALAQLSRVDDDAPIAGRTVERVRSVGKHLLVELSGDLVLRTHMRMAGSWHVYRPGERWQRPRSAMRVVLETADFQAVAFDVPVAEFRTARRLLAMNVRESSGWDRATRPGMRTTGRLDSSAGLWVYGRAGKPCRVCGEPVVRQHRGPEARSTFFCPRCQSLPAV